jgi:peroxiredoxin/mono/diheme cytochrome c family protein
MEQSMTPSRWRIAALVALAAVGLGVGLLAGREAAKPLPARTVADFRLADPRQPDTAVRLSDFKDRKAVVVVFLGTECPLNNLYLPTLARLSQEYAPKGVAFLGVNSNSQDKPAEVAAHVRKNALPFPVLKDADGGVAATFKAERTPEAFVLDPSFTVRYHGRIDDQFGITYRAAQPTRRDLACALDDLLAGRTVAVPETEVAGCFINRPPAPRADATVTYAKQVARIVQRRCQECHRPGQIGPMAFMNYADVAAWADTIRQEVTAGRMPPWHADPAVGHFQNDRRLPPAERDTLLAWIDQGCPQGDEKDLPPARTYPEGWGIGTPDVVYTMQEEFEVPAEMPKRGIPYKYFLVDPGFTEDRWVERAEAKAGAASVVHHIIVFILPPKNSAEPFPPGPPVLPPISAEARKATVLTGTAPGDMPLILPPGYARKIPAGAKLVFQMHYTPNGTPAKDRSSVGLIFAKKPPERQTLSVPVFKQDIHIPAGEADYRAEAWGPWNLNEDKSVGFTEDVTVLGFMPHMHLRGKDFFIEAVHPDGRKEALLSVPHYNFNWQAEYRLVEPLRLAKGGKIHCVAHFDNSPGNRNNPDPTQDVYWGDQTWEEMLIGWTEFAYDRKP